MEETVHDLTKNIRQGKKSMTTTDKEYVDGSFNLKTSRHNIIYTFFYSNISDFEVDLEVMIDEGTYKKSIQNMHNLGWK